VQLGRTLAAVCYQTPRGMEVNDADSASRASAICGGEGLHSESEDLGFSPSTSTE
jgi:hypothetical protein